VSPADRSPAATLFRGALDLLGTYERRDLDATALRERRLMASTDNAEILFAQVSFPAENGESGPAFENAQAALVLADEWQSLEFEVPRPTLLRSASLRLDPLNTRGVVSIASLGLFRATDDREIWCAKNASILEVCTVAGDAFAIPGSDSVDLVCTGSRPHLLLPALPELPDVPLRLRIWLKPSRNQALLASHWARLWTARENLEQAVASALSEAESLRAAVVTSAGEGEEQRAALALSQEAQRLRAEVASSQRQAEELRGAVASSQEEARELRAALASSQEKARELRASLASSRGEVEELRASLASSRSEVAELRAMELDAAALKRALVEVEGRFREQTAALSRAEAELEESRRSLARARDSLGRSAREKELFVRWLRQLQRAFEAVMTTRRWRVGDALGRGYGRIRFRQQVPTAVKEASAIFAELERSNILDEEHEPGG
jgi:predicted  nucleic acid-binding Zn-ribbon protein